MIIDNADDTDLFISSGEAVPQNPEDSDSLTFEGNLSHYIPECSHEAILVTTRNKQAGVKSTKGCGVIEAGTMKQA